MTNKEIMTAYEKKLHDLKMIRVYFLRELNTFHRFEDIRKVSGFNAEENAHDQIDYLIGTLDESIKELEDLIEKVMELEME